MELLLAYLHLGSEMFSTAVDEATPEPVHWQTLSPDGLEVTRSARLPRVIFMR